MSEIVQAVAATVLLASGTATRYDEGVMDQVVANRANYGQLDLSTPHGGYVALLDCTHLGRAVWLQQGGRIGGPYLVADCAQAAHRQMLVDRGWAVDLSYELGLEWGVTDDVGRGFRVWSIDPRLLWTMPGQRSSRRMGERPAAATIGRGSLRPFLRPAAGMSRRPVSPLAARLLRTGGPMTTPAAAALPDGAPARWRF